jgi:hypothetical protein
MPEIIKSRLNGEENTKRENKIRGGTIKVV